MIRRMVCIALSALAPAGVSITQIADNLNDVAVWTFNQRIYNSKKVEAALSLSPGYCKRAWYKYSGTPYNYFPEFADIPPLLNAGGAIFEGGVQVPNIQPNVGWPHDHPYDDDHAYPYRMPDPIFSDLVSLDADGNIYWINSIYFDSITVASVANENHITYVLYWAYQQIDANVNALEFDQIGGAYLFSTSGVQGDNPNLGYDVYALGTANFANRISLISRGDSLFWQMPQAELSSLRSQSSPEGLTDPMALRDPTLARIAPLSPLKGACPLQTTPMARNFLEIPRCSVSSGVDAAAQAFDDDPTTFWYSDVGDSHWIEIDFGRIRTIQQVYLQFPADHVLDSFSVVYWDGIEWQDFAPPINVAGNADSICSFLVEPTQVTKVMLSTTDAEVWLAEFQLFGCGFRQFLLERYCTDSGWTPTDPRWELEKLVDFSDTSQCPDGTMNTFNYRKYLQAHGWTGNPLGGEIDSSNFLDPPNPLFKDFGYGAYYSRLMMWHFFNDSTTRNTLKSVFEAGYDFQRQNRVWTSIRDSVRAYAATLGRTVYVTTNGSARGFREGADYLLDPLGGPPMLPMYPVSDPLDTLMHHMDGSQAMLNIWRMRREWALSFMDTDVPVVAFIDFGHQGNLFSHLGGYAIYGYPADERAEYLRCYPMEMYAAGYVFCFPVREDQFDAWRDTLSNGTRLIDVIKQQTDFLNAHKEIYRNVVVSPFESQVRVNGVIPFNGQWRIVNGQFDSPMNQSKVTIALTESEVEPTAYLHIINHHWDSTSLRMMPQESVPVEIPVKDGCLMARVISPDFPEEDTLSFTLIDSAVKCTIPTLAYYAVIILDLLPSSRLKGDVNGDGEIDTSDVVRTVNIILGIGPSPTECELWAADCNGDEEVNVLDVVGIVNVILGTGSCTP